MKPVKIYSRLLILSLLLMSMGFPNVMPEDDSESGCGKGKYVKVGFLACTRQVPEVKGNDPISERGHVEKPKKENAEKIKTSVKLTSPVADNIQIISKHVSRALSL